MSPRILLPLLLACLTIFGSQTARAQKVGVVLSGGGAAAIAHVGFLKALEENGIPIDFIAGTSMGAIIAGLYASGWPPNLIEEYMKSDEFQRSLSGELDNKYHFFFKKGDSNASWFTFKFSPQVGMQASLPTNLIDPLLQDFRALEVFSVSSARAGYDFDSLFVPFRCVATDIEGKRQVVFRKGNLGTAIRASATYPFYVPAIEVDGRLLFDGGIYNNFPSDVLYHDFLPDVILGSNVSENVSPPRKDDLISQLKNMIISKSNFEQVCERMIIIEPETKVGTFDFRQAESMMKLGYQATIERMDEILEEIDRRVSPEELGLKRMKFRNGMRPLIFDEITFTGIQANQRSYVRNILGKDDTISVKRLIKPYFRTANDDKIKYVYPTAVFKPSTGFYRLNLDIEPEKDIHLEVGGQFSSRPINTGFIALRYNLLRGIATTVSANSYFGKFYGSVKLAARVDFPSKYQIALEPHFIINRWDYFKSLATFFEDARPSFVVMKETFGGLHIIGPAGNRGKLIMDGRIVHLEDSYYQTTNFSRADTTDKTNFNALTFGAVYERNTLNRKQYASSGTRLSISGRWVSGRETTIPGSTTAAKDTAYAYHNWPVARLKYINYFDTWGPFKVGFALEGAASGQAFFKNYIASAIRAPHFAPIPEAHTFFIPQYRSHLWASGGMMFVTEIAKNLELRAEGYVFNPFGRIVANDVNEAEYRFDNTRYFIGSGSLVFNSPIGPAAVSVNYYDRKEIPWSVLFTFGYTLFNRNAFD
jgi:NTE family protein